MAGIMAITIAPAITHAVITTLPTTAGIITAATTAATITADTIISVAAMAITILIIAGSGTASGSHTVSARAGAGRRATTSTSGFAVERLGYFNAETPSKAAAPKSAVFFVARLPLFRRVRISYPRIPNPI
jgi:hypothetical protein